jgi:hypothetical protein
VRDFKVCGGFVKSRGSSRGQSEVSPNSFILVKICRKEKEMEAAASLYYSSLFDLIQITKYIG